MLQESYSFSPLTDSQSLCTARAFTAWPGLSSQPPSSLQDVKAHASQRWSFRGAALSAALRKLRGKLSLSVLDKKPRLSGFDRPATEGGRQDRSDVTDGFGRSEMAVGPGLNPLKMDCRSSYQGATRVRVRVRSWEQPHIRSWSFSTADSAVTHFEASGF